MFLRAKSSELLGKRALESEMMGKEAGGGWAPLWG